MLEFLTKDGYKHGVYMVKHLWLALFYQQITGVYPTLFWAFRGTIELLFLEQTLLYLGILQFFMRS